MTLNSDTPTQTNDLLSEVTSYLEPQLKKIEQILQKVAASDSALIREIGEYVCLSTGKKLRPIMTLLAAEAFGATGDTPVHVAAALETVHVATLLHDDVIDKADIRRGQPTVNAQWGDDIAILMADYLFSAGFDLALNHLDPAPLKVICQVTRKMCEGEMFQIEHREQWLTPEDYLYIISCKTAYLFSACASLGGMMADIESDKLADLTSYGLGFGRAFQITDDTLDYTADDGRWGKPVGIDLAGGKQTLPLILALDEASPDKRRKLKELLLKGDDLGSILEIINGYDAIGRSVKIARDHARQATSFLTKLKPCNQKAFDYLALMPDYIINRRF